VLRVKSCYVLRFVSQRKINSLIGNISCGANFSETKREKYKPTFITTQFLTSSTCKLSSINICGCHS